MRRDNTEAHDHLLGAACQWLHLHRIQAWPSQNAGRYSPKQGRYFKQPGTRVGVWDITAIIPGTQGRALMIEIKTGKAELTRDEKLFRAELSPHGVQFFVARSLNDLEKIFGRNPHAEDVAEFERLKK